MSRPSSPGPAAGNPAYARAWAELGDLLDRQLSPLGLKAIDALAPRPGETIVDIGCGAGQTVLQLADRVGAAGRVVGVDMEPLLLDVARRRAEGLDQVEFVAADAQTMALPADSMDGVFSRFGVMTFADPVAAFANFRRILKPAGRLAFVCWRALRENELDVLPLEAAGLAEMVDAAPFSFAEPDEVRAVLEGAGFEDVTMAAHDERVSSGGLDEMAAVVLKVGALGRILRQRPRLRAAVEPRVREALARRLDGGSVALNAATWVVTAHA